MTTKTLLPIIGSAMAIAGTAAIWGGNAADHFLATQPELVAVHAEMRAQRDSLRDEMAELSVTARLRICEMHGLFSSECPQFEKLDH